jgi:PKD repeat protein
MGNAQTARLWGEVFNVSEGSAVPGHSVMAFMPEAGDSILTVTDSTGQFYIDVTYDSGYSELVYIVTPDPCSGNMASMVVNPVDSLPYISLEVCKEDTLISSCQALFWYDYLPNDTIEPMDSVVNDRKSLFFVDASTGDILEWNWDFGDGSTSNLQNPQHHYDSAGYYLVRLHIVTPDCESTYNRTVIAGNPEDTSEISCQANFQYYPLDNDSINFMDSIVPDWQTIQFQDVSIGDVQEWSWDFGDGNTSNLQNPRHSYDSTGTYPVVLSIVTPDCESTISKTVWVIMPEEDTTETDCQAMFSYSYMLNDTIDQQTLYFWDMSEGNVMEWNWNFGDGSSSSIQNPVHRFDSIGYHLVSLTIKNATCQSTYSEWINTQIPEDTVYSDCYAMFYPIFEGNNTVWFRNESAGNNLSYYWDFGDGTTDTDKNPRHTYSQQGDYLVNLSIVSEDSCFASFEMMVFVCDTITDSGLVAIFVPEFNDTEVLFNNHSKGDIWNYHWDFGDETTSSIKEPTHTYADYGVYIVTLGVGNAMEVNTFTMEINIEEQTYKGYYNNPTQVDQLSEQQLNIDLYPNPVGESTTLSIIADYHSTVQLRLLSIMGGFIRSQDSFIESGSNTIELNTSGLESGYYLLQIIDENGDINTIRFTK